MLFDENSAPNPTQLNLDNSMIPAINVVFLLLIFFIMAGHIENRNTLLEIPSSQSTGEIQTDNVLTITILPDGQSLLNNQRINGSLSDQLRQQKVDKNTVLTLRIHKQLPVNQIDTVVSAAKESGIGRLQIVTEATF